MPLAIQAAAARDAGPIFVVSAGACFDWWMTADVHASDLADFVVASPSSYHAAAEVARRLVAAGYAVLDERDDWTDAVLPGARLVVLRDGAVLGIAIPESATAITPFRILGSHTDSPAFALKPKPTIGTAGWLQAGVEVYGGPLLMSWFDRDLELAGRLVDRDGIEHLVRTGPLLRIPHLAIHLDREANTAFAPDRQTHLQPVFGVGDARLADVVGLLAAKAGLDAADVSGYDILTADTQAPGRLGVRGELLASGRLDNLSSVHAGLTALLGMNAAGGAIAVLAAFDHEEVGSESRSGASGPLLAEVLERVAAGLGAGRSELARAIAASWCLSADAGHSVHPNYPERHDPANRPIAGSGPLLKINAVQRYTTDAHGAALWRDVCERADVQTQEFVSNNRVPCGSTIGPLTATRLGIRTLDVGVPLLSMHSARELAHIDDLDGLARAAAVFFRG